ncbi:MAG: tetratricopeptide repeat protein [Planctomycetaceae bacterium]|jgi:tetratricopeptide (TPR) repeat protein|nr:tetratricopeptide repeat protein [Planctomycetaceae bacterium]
MINKNNFKNIYRFFAVSILFFVAVIGFGNGIFVIADDGKNEGLAKQDQSDKKLTELLNKPDETLARLLKILATQEKEFGKTSPEVAKTCSVVAVMYQLLKKNDKAAEYFLRTIRIREKTSGKNHPDTADAYRSFGTFYESTGELKKAMEFYTKSFSVWENILEAYCRKYDNPPTENHPERGELEFQLAKELLNFAGLFGKLNKHDLAYQFYLDAHLTYEGVNSDGAKSKPKFQFKNDQLDKALTNTKIHYEKNDPDPEPFDEIIKEGGAYGLADRCFLGETMQFSIDELKKEFLQGKKTELLKDVFDKGKPKRKTKTK